MPSLRAVVRRLQGSGAALDLDTESGRAFLQERVAFFNKVALLISGGFFLVAAVASPWHVLPPAAVSDLTWLPVLHLGTLVASLVFWQLCRRRPGLSKGLLEVLDGASLAVPILGFALQVPFVPPLWSGQIASSLVLTFTNMGIARAVLVPGTTAHAARVTTLAAGPVVAAIAYLPVPPGFETDMAWVAQLWPFLWMACAVVVATLACHVIYGLREEVRQARRLGQYTLEEKLGEGGMGTVYRASHAMLRRPTAIKLLPPDRAGEVALERFEREVQLTASLSHPNTISVFDYGRTPDGIFYYAMEYLDGTDLEDLVRLDGPQPPARVAHILGQVASALVEAHGVGLIHRDIKPENVILCERGGIPDVAKVVDFGLVKDLERSSDPRLTRADVVQGTPLYLSPEAIRSPETVGPRSDLYSLGAVGYYLLCGSHVFEGRTVVEVCAHHLHTPPVPPSERLGTPLPAELERLVLACLEKEVEHRPRSAAALRDDLGRLEGLGAWDDESARRWWGSWRRRPERPRKTTNGGSVTVSVSLRDRGTL